MVNDRFLPMISRLLVLLGLCVADDVARSAGFHATDGVAHRPVDNCNVPALLPAVASFGLGCKTDAGGLSGQFCNTAGRESVNFRPSDEALVRRALREPRKRGLVCTVSGRRTLLVGKLAVAKDGATSAKSRNAEGAEAPPPHRRGTPQPK